MARRLHIEAKEKLPNWETFDWGNIDHPGDEEFYKKCLEDREERMNHVFEYYKKSDIATMEGQRRIARATGELDYSLLFHVNKQERGKSLKLAKGFLALAKAINDGKFSTPAIIGASLATFSGDHTPRIRITNSNGIDGKFLKEIRKVLMENQCPKYHPISGISGSMN
ncbi:unnamed protein product, partial [Mesorhabditis belari]|uniref:Uncharacterized protein n=1 Tax=Mesorhabditis belari TaxID=2138241 RepID=A0AAF3FP51_9BILA